MDLQQEGTNEQCQPKRTIGVIRIVLSEQNNGLYPVPGHARFWKGTLAQHKGRLHRSYNGKQEVLICDYVDFRIPMLERMYHKRLSGYSAIGYTVQGSKTSPAGDNRWYGGINYLGFEKAAQGAMRLSSMELSRELIQNMT